MKLAIRGHDLGEKGGFDLAEKLTDFGFDGVQLVCYKTFSDIGYKPGQMSAYRAEEISRRLKQKDKRVFLIGAYFNPVHSNPATVENGIAVFEEYLDYAAALGCNVVGSETGSYNDDKWTYNPKNRTEEALCRVIAVFKRLCLFAARQNACVAIEGAAGHVCYDVKTLNRAVNEINSDNLRVIFDLYNYLDDSNYSDYLNILQEGVKTFKNKILCFHVKDCAIVDGKLKQVPIGKGMFDFDKIFSIIKGHNEDAVLILEGTTGENISPAVDLINAKWRRQ